MRKIWLVAAALIWAMLAGGAARAADVPQLQPDDRVLGKADAPITIFEYFSLTCPHCATFDQVTLPQLKKDWIDTGKAKLVYRDYPLDQEAMTAAVVARCLPPERYSAFIAAQYDARNRYGIESTPTFFVNGKKVVGDLPYADFVKYLAFDPNAGGVALAADRGMLDRIRQWFGTLPSRS